MSADTSGMKRVEGIYIHKRGEGWGRREGGRERTLTGKECSAAGWSRIVGGERRRPELTVWTGGQGGGDTQLELEINILTALGVIKNVVKGKELMKQNLLWDMNSLKKLCFGCKKLGHFLLHSTIVITSLSIFIEHFITEFSNAISFPSLPSFKLQEDLSKPVTK